MALTNISTGELVTAAWLNAIVDRVNAFLISVTGGIWTGTVQKIMQSFRGLHLRTHPNYLASPSQVMLTALEEVVMNDGTRYQPSASMPLAADITVSGPGGLDTGTEAISTWYDIYLIGKSSTTANADLRLMFHRAKKHSLEAEIPINTDAFRGLRLATGTATDKLSQGVQFTAAGPMPFIDVILARSGTVPVSTIWFTLQTSAGSDPTGTVLATSVKLDATAVNTTAQAIRFTFTSPPTVATGTQYHLVMEGDYARSDTNFIWWYGVAAGGYASGVARQWNSAAWSNATGVGDFWFRCYVTRFDTALTFPTGYDQSIKIGQVYNSAGGHFETFRQKGTRVSFLIDHLMLNASTSAVETLTDLSTLLPPLALRVYAAAQNTTNAGTVMMGPVPDGYNMRTSTFANNTITVQPASANSSLTGFPSDIITETQAVYFRVGVGTGFVWVTGYDWGG